MTRSLMAKTYCGKNKMVQIAKSVENNLLYGNLEFVSINGLEIRRYAYAQT